MAQLRTYRRDAAARLGLLDVVTTTELPTGPDADVSVVVDHFAGAQANTLYENGYVYPLDGAQAFLQRPIRQAGLSSSTATLKVSWPWPAPLEDGTEVEILRLVPAVRELGRDGWREIINSVLRDTPTIRRYPITATAGTIAYDVPVWMDTEDQALGIYDPHVAATSPAVLSTNLKSIRYDGELVSVELWSAYSPGDVFSLAVYQPLASRVRHAGVWDDSTVGLVDDDDEALGNRQLVMAMTIQRVAEMELVRPDARSKELWARTLAEWTPIAAGLKRRLVPARHEIVRVAPMVSSSWPKSIF